MHEGKAQSGIYDEISTPKYAVAPLLKNIKVKGLTVWEPTGTQYANGIIDAVVEAGAKVLDTGDEDFFSIDPSDQYDIIITNPPYSKKYQFLRKCYELGKPFAMLLPLTTLEGKDRNILFEENGIQLLVMDKRVNFTGGKGSWFNVSWFCWNLLPFDLMFEKVYRNKKDISFKRTETTSVW